MMTEQILPFEAYGIFKSLDEILKFIFLIELLRN